MPSELTITLIAALAAAVLLALIAYNRKKTFAKLKEAYASGGPSAYLALLDDKFVKLSITAKESLLLKLDAYIAAGDSKNTEATINKLDVASLGSSGRVLYYQKRLNYFVSARNKAESQKSYSMLCQAADMAHGHNYKAECDQGRLLLKVFIEKDTSVIGELTELKSREDDGPAKGMTCYLLARLYAAAGDNESAAKEVSEAAALLNGSAYGAIAKAAESDLSQLLV